MNHRHVPSAEAITAPCDACPTTAIHTERLWFPCEQPHRLLDQHGLFDEQCADCHLMYVAWSCPRSDLPLLVTPELVVR